MRFHRQNLLRKMSIYEGSIVCPNTFAFGMVLEGSTQRLELRGSTADGIKLITTKPDKYF